MSSSTMEGAWHAALDHDPADVVFTFAWINWQGAQKRGMNMPDDRLALTLMESPAVRRLLVCSNARSLPIKAARSVLQGSGVPFPANGAVAHVEPVRLRRDDARGVRGTRRWVAAYERQMRRQATRLGLERPAIVSFHPLIAAYGDFGWAGTVTYCAMDDWAAHPAKRSRWPLLEAAYAEIAASGRRVCAVSPAILERIRPSGRAKVVPNGIEPFEWLEPGPAPQWMRNASGPRMLYMGTLDSRLDRDWVSEVSRAFPGASIHLVGRVFDHAHLEPILRLPNVELHGNVGRREIAAIVAGADVGLLPHVSNPLTRAMSPLKVYEYVAGGLPVVATDLEPVRGVDERVTLVEPGGDFVSGVRQAIAAGHAPERERRQFIAANSWNRRHAEILELMLAG